MPNRPIDAAQLRTALAPVHAWLDGTEEPPPRPVIAAAVRTSLRAFAQRYPGKAVEVRVPPFAAVQCLEGGAHTRGTPPHVVETDPRDWLRLATGRLAWAAAVDSAAVRASGHRAAEIGALLPLVHTAQSRDSE
ncbi:sterol carrier family protein [Pseudonocardia acaciae]|uniref:sterol carrier family protein n=1 Tax=Pseudonocardia acaciae TaxID=551276 RepID=UPI00048CA1F1|nr:sterol carrier family protein [Pseudonocardia acaciae]